MLEKEDLGAWKQWVDGRGEGNIESEEQVSLTAELAVVEGKTSLSSNCIP